jgi:GT2 family glycosyltransferase/glycosyltransferase involved in cell wall biosynthesis
VSARLTFYLRFLRRLFAGLPKRAYLTLRYHGLRETLYRIVTFPLRLTPLGARLGLSARLQDPSAPARAWYRRNWRPVAIVIPTYGPPGLVEAAVRTIRRTTNARRVRIVVADDGSPPEHVAGLRRIEGVELIEGGEQRGFAANCNRGLRRVRPGEDAVLLNSDVLCQPGWLEVLQHTARRAAGSRVGVVGGKLLYPDHTIQFAGTIRNPGAPEWFDHRFRFRPADHPPANVMQPVLSVTGACMYITSETLDEVGLLDEAYSMAYEDVDYCLRVWESGRRVLYAPASEVVHLESKTRGMEQGDRELASQSLFWERWGDWFDRRDVRAPDGGLRIVYVTQDTGVGGGHRVVFEHLNGLAERGHHCELWTLGDGPPDWFDLRVPVRTFHDYARLSDALAPVEAIKVATWWQTAPAVWEASVRRGVGVYFVQDIETSYYDVDLGVHGEVLTTYRPEFAFLTTSSWVHDRLTEFVPVAKAIAPGVDLEAFRDLGRERSPDAVLAVGRVNPLKNFPLTRDAYLALPEPRPPLWLFGVEPEVAEGMGERVTYHVKPSDEEVNELLSTCAVFLQTSRHEGFCLPIIEAMACGTPVVCTDADGNRDFCVDGENCLMPEARPRAVREALERVLHDEDLRARLVEAGKVTAAEHAWPRKLDEVDAWLREVAEARGAGRMPAPA